LLSYVQIDQLRIYFDPNSKKFLMGTEPPVSKASVPHSGSSSAHETNPTELEHKVTSKIGTVAEKLGVIQSKAQLYAEGDDDEEIVFKPPVSEKLLRVPSEQTTNEFIQPLQISDANWLNNGAPVSFQSITSVSAASTYVQSLPMSSVGWAANGVQMIPSIAPRSIQPFKNSDPTWVSTGSPLIGPQSTVQMPSFSNIIRDQHAPVSSVPRFSSPDNPHMLPEQNSFLLSAMKNANIGTNGFLEHRVNGGLNGFQTIGNGPQVSAEVTWNSTNPILNQFKSTEVNIPSAFDSVVPSVVCTDGRSTKFMETLTTVSKKNPVSRPGRHVGPPPGFSNIPSKRQDDSISVGNGHHVQADDIWLNGYRPPLDHVNNQRQANSNVTTSSGAFTTPFPFPGKHAFSMYAGQTNEKQWQDFHLFEPTKQHPEHRFQQGNQQNGPLAEPQPAQSMWSGRYPV
jgi:protein SMG7